MFPIQEPRSEVKENETADLPNDGPENILSAGRHRKRAHVSVVLSASNLYVFRVHYSDGSLSSMGIGDSLYVFHHLHIKIH